MSTQLTIEQAIAAGERGMALAVDNATAADPAFKEKAEAAILAHLRTVGQCSGEVLTDVAKAHGARPREDRAFGAVYASLLRRGMVRVVGFERRLKGHGSVGAKVYAIAY